MEVLLDPVLEAFALEVQNTVMPYPPATIANSPSNPKRHWYERGYGSRWVVKSGEVHGRNTSQMMNRRWSAAKIGRLRWVIRNAATYSGYLHSAAHQARWAGPRGWRTDDWAVRQVLATGKLGAMVRQRLRYLFSR